MTKILALIGALFTSGSAVLNSDTTTETTEEETVVVERETRPKRHNLEDLRENGLSYPSDEFFSNLTEDQVLLVQAFIDDVNLSNDFSSMTDEEIKDVLDEVKEGIELLFEEMGVELPSRPQHSKNGNKGPRGGRKHHRGTKNLPEEIVEETEDTTV